MLHGKIRHHDDAHSLAAGPFRLLGLETGLVARKVDMRAFVDDEGIGVIKGAAPEGVGGGGRQVLEAQRLLKRMQAIVGRQVPVRADEDRGSGRTARE